MATKKVTVTVSNKIYEMLEQYSSEKGLKRSAVVAIAIEKLCREEDKLECEKK